LFDIKSYAFWFFDKSRVLSQTKVENNTSFGRFFFQLWSDHGICQRTCIFIQIEERAEPDSLSYQGEYVTKSWMKRHAHNIK